MKLEKGEGEAAARVLLLDIIKKMPGIHFRELHRRSSLAMGQVEHHLDNLRRTGRVTGKRVGNHTRFYPGRSTGARDRELLGVLRQKMLRDILMFLLESGPAGPPEIMARFGMVKSSVAFYMDKLIRAGAVEKHRDGRFVLYIVVRPARIRKLILRYREGFGERLVERVEGLWGNI